MELGVLPVLLAMKKIQKQEIVLYKLKWGILKSKILGNNLVETEIGSSQIVNWKEIPLNENLDTKNLHLKIKYPR